MTLEHDLRALADGFPETPALAPRVVAAAQRASAGRRRRRRVALLAFALLLLVPATALAVSGDLRDRVLETFGLRDVKITAVTRLPELGADVRRLELGPRISLEQARRDLGRDVSPPTVLGRARRDLRGAARVGRGHHVPVRAEHDRRAHRRAQARPRERRPRDDREDDHRQDRPLRDQADVRSRSTAARRCS